LPTPIERPKCLKGDWYNFYSKDDFLTAFPLSEALSFRVIQSKLPTPIERPKCLKGDWYNFYSKDDFLTAFPLSEA
ncbi:hypothetical protein ED867_20805, partial [Acinetobacter baumannii]